MRDKVTRQGNLPTEQELITIIAKAEKPMSVEAIIRSGGYKKKYLYHAEELLRALETEGVLSFKRGFYIAPGISRIVGTLVIQRSGAFFVIPENKTIQDSDIFIPPECTNGAWARDTVEVLVLKKKTDGRRSEGLIVTIRARATSCVVAKIVRSLGNNEYLFAPVNNKVPTMFTARYDDATSAIELQSIYVLKPKQEQTKTLWSADILENLGSEETTKTQEKIVKISHDLLEYFPQDVISAVAEMPTSITMQAYPERVDMQQLPFVTIDGEDSRDFDDAICVLQTSTGYILYVAIADVTHYVQEGSPVDVEAQKRSNSFYFPESVIPMLPEALSNVLCSLQPNVPRLAVVVEMHYTSDGILEKTCAHNAIICSSARLTYKEVQEYFDTKVGFTSITNGGEIAVMLEHAHTLSKQLYERRRARGGIFFSTTSPHFTIENNAVSNISLYTNYYSHSLIEEFMLATNEAVATMLTEKSFPLLYRVHPIPSVEKLEKLAKYIQYMFPEEALPKFSEPDFLPKVLTLVHGTPQEAVIHIVAIKSMMQAYYSPHNEGHYGLQSELYCHFTSPIRRYADVTVHRSLKALLAGKTPDAVASEEKLSAIAEINNLQERRALDAEREIHKRLGILFMKQHCGETFDVILAGITPYSIFVEFPTMSISGSIALSALSDDFYEVVEEQQRIRGRRTGKSYALGDILSVVIVDASFEGLDIQCVLAEQYGMDTRRKNSGVRRKKTEGAGSSREKGKSTYNGSRATKKTSGRGVQKRSVPVQQQKRGEDEYTTVTEGELKKGGITKHRKGKGLRTQNTITETSSKKKQKKRTESETAVSETKEIGYKKTFAKRAHTKKKSVSEPKNKK